MFQDTFIRFGENVPHVLESIETSDTIFPGDLFCGHRARKARTGGPLAGWSTYVI